MSTVEDAPRFNPEEVVRLARDFYGLDARAKELPSERDQNFLLTEDGGGRFVLKIANASEDVQVLDMQNRAMLHLAEEGQAPLAPRVIPALDGSLIRSATGRDARPHSVRLVGFIDGLPLAEVRPHGDALLRDLGRVLAGAVAGLETFSHPSADRHLIWDMQTGPETVRTYRDHIDDKDRRLLLDFHIKRFEAEAAPGLPGLEKSTIHNDANDYNVIVAIPDGSPEAFGECRVAALIDFGDMIRTYTLAELAVGCAYAMLDKESPLAAAAAVVAGYHSARPLNEGELAMLFHLITLRLLMSAAICARQTHLAPDREYLSISNRQVWRLLEKLRNVHPSWARGVFRKACGLDPVPGSRDLVRWLESNRGRFAPVIEIDLAGPGKTVFDLSIGSPLFESPGAAGDMDRLAAILSEEMKSAGAQAGIGRYDEARLVYTAEAFRPSGNPLGETRTVHLGIDIFTEPGRPVFAPLDGVVHSFGDNDAPQDYGPTVVLTHETEPGRAPFHTLYGHLSRESLDGLAAGRPVKRGKRLGRIGASSENGGWPPHLHFQVIGDLLGFAGDFPGVAGASEKDVWLSLCPDPNLILGIPDEDLARLDREPGEILDLRKARLGRSLSVSYKKPLKIVRGWMQHLYDETGRVFLDAVNNVPHVGHSHPRVVDAVRKQMAVLNTNTRYLHDIIVAYALRLAELLPESLSVCTIVNSGSEANDLALRLARNYTGRTDMVVLEGAYHGNLSSLVDISPYKFDGPGGKGAPPSTWKAVMPDLFRGPYRCGDPEAGAKYAGYVKQAVDRIRAEGRQPAGFICEPLLSCGGQIVLPEGFLREAYRHVREAGGVCIADEVQVGFGRVGTHTWGFETQGVVPDIVTMGKPIGNGFPLAAVVTTPEISEAFATGMEYFNTYGGNPVACAAGLAVLDVVRDEGLRERALNVGGRLKGGLEELKKKHPLVGDVRGLGLFLGVELVSDPESLTPAVLQASYVVERMREQGILVSTDGPDRNVVKIKPPLAFSEADADLFIAVLADVLSEYPLKAET